MTEPGTPDDTRAAISVWGPDLTNFTLTIDTRMESEGLAGYHIFFRAIDDGNGGGNTYILMAVAEGVVVLARGGIDGDSEPTLLGGGIPQSLDLKGGVNRTTIHCVGDQIRIWINGEEIIQARDSALAGGRFGFGAVTGGAPPTVIFDNIIATTPASP
jgi:hypothetical protein